GRNSIKVWAQHPTDSYPGNDTLTEQVIYNQPLVRQFPYKEGFESNDGFWYAQGVHSSWDWGQPQSENLKQAYEGQRVWKTNLRGGYQNHERSYLYSPCFDIHSLAIAHLQFYMIEDI